MMQRTGHMTGFERQRGFTLLEILLSIGIMAVLLTGVYEMFYDWSQRAIDRYAARDVLRVQNAAQDYVLVNFETIRTAGPLNQFVEIPIADLTAANYLPNGFQAVTAFNQRVRVFRRLTRQARRNADGTVTTDGGGNTVYNYSIEVSAVSDQPAVGDPRRVPTKRLMDAARAGGPKMGVISRDVIAGVTFTGRVTSLFNEWWYSLADITSAGYAGTPTLAEGGYLAAFGRVTPSDSEPNDLWLYRVAINGRPDLNRMQTDLRMNDNRIENVGNLVADKVSVTGNAVFRGLSQGAATENAQAMTVDRAMRVNGTYVAGNTATENRINMKTSTASCSVTTDGLGNRNIVGAGCSVNGGELQVISAATAANDAVMTLGSLVTDGSVITDRSTITGAADVRGTSTFNTLSAGSLLATTRVVAPTANVTGNTINIEQLQTANMTVDNASNVGGSLVSASIRPTAGSNFTATDLDVSNTATFSSKIQAQGLNATQSMYIKNATGGYNDTVLGRNVTCSADVIGGSTLTFCEPNGTVFWQGGTVKEDCAPNGTGYTCTFTKGGAPMGQCVYTRAKNAGTNQAYHKVNCI